jgi:hypothetical protein
MRPPFQSGTGDSTWEDLFALVAVVTLLKQLSTGAPQRVQPITVGPRMTYEQLSALAASIGFPDPATAAAVAMAESSGVVAAQGDSGNSLGLWQINLPSHPEYNAELLLRSAEYNARAAFAISKSGTDWTPWTQFRNGAYKRYMPNA